MAKKKIMGQALGFPPDIRSVSQTKEVSGDGLVGVEVELEGTSRVNEIRDRAKFWAVKDDGSLKNRGVEFVFVQPLGGVDIIRALDELERLVGMMRDKPILSERTSVHVHLDIRDLDEDQYINLIILYLIFERSLFRVCGPERYHNTFCRSIGETHGLVTRVANMNVNKEMIPLELDRLRRNKYLALNVGSTMNFGSLEFRGHRGAWKKEELLNWINLILALKEYAKRDILWDKELINISSQGYYEFAADVFGQWVKTMDCPDFVFEIIEGVRDAQDIIYARGLNNCSSDFSPRYNMDGELDISKRFLDYVNGTKAGKGEE